MSLVHKSMEARNMEDHDAQALRELVQEAYRTPDLSVGDPKVRAVRVYRELTGSGLREAVDFVDQAVSGISKPAYRFTDGGAATHA